MHKYRERQSRKEEQITTLYKPSELNQRNSEGQTSGADLGEGPDGPRPPFCWNICKRFVRK